MTRAQLETLAIVSYRQPLTRPEIDDIRGVDSGPVLKTLLDRDLIKILGKKDEPGRPLLYGTTQTFLEFFGLKSLKDLPSLREFTELSDDSRRVFAREMAEASMPEETTTVDVDALAAAASAVAPGAPADDPSDSDSEPDF
jgi:segregation and condensation protein B